MKKLKLNIQLFANKKATNNDTTPSGVSSSGFRITITVEETGINISNNTSALSFTAKIESVSGAGYSITDGGSLDIQIKDNNANTSWKSVKSATYDSVLSGTPRTLTTTKNVTHKNDGTLAIQVRAVWKKLKDSTYIPNSKTVTAPSSGTLALTTIARADTISATDANVGSNPTITISHNSSSFRHNITATFSGKDVNGDTQTYTYNVLLKANDTGNITTITNWQLPLELYDICLESLSITGILTCQTYNGNTLIGTKTGSIKALIPSTCKPTVSAPTYIDTDSYSYDIIGVPVVGKSILEYDFSNTFTPFHNSPLDRYELYVNGSLVYSGTATNYLRTAAIQNTSNTYELRAYDKRGNFGTSGVQTLTAYSYNPPSATINVERDTTTTTTAIVTYSGSITNINNNNRNSKSFKIYHKESTSSTWPSTPDLSITNNYNPSGTLQITGLDNDKKYDFKIVADDGYAGDYVYKAILSETFTLINFAADGKGLAFGKISEEANTFEVGLASKFEAIANFLSTLNVSSKNNLKINNVGIVNALKQDFIDIMYPVGSTYVTRTNSNPSSYLGGTWTLVDKGYAMRSLVYDSADPSHTDDIASINTTNTSRGRVWVTLSDHTINILIIFLGKVAITDGALTWLTLKLANMGVNTKFRLDSWETAFNDGGNGAIMLKLGSNGVFESLDVMVRGSSTASIPVANQGNTAAMFTHVMPIDYMLDSFCDKFYWQRTA